MERLANVVTTDLYNSEEGDLCLIDEPVVKQKGRPRNLINFSRRSWLDEDSKDVDELCKRELLI